MKRFIPIVAALLLMSGAWAQDGLTVTWGEDRADHSTLDISEGDLFLLCSDGLTDSVPDWTLREILAGVDVTCAHWALPYREAWP